MMQRVKISQNFYLDEVVCPEIYTLFGAASRWFIRPEVIAILQELRNRFGVTMVNNWSQKGKVSADVFLQMPKIKQLSYFTGSGLRSFNSNIGARNSLHKYGAAADAKFINATAEDARNNIIKHFHSIYKPLGLTTIELNTEGWLHFDIRNTGTYELMKINN